MGFRYLEKDIDSIVKCEPLAIEKALSILKIKLDVYSEGLREENNLYQEYGRMGRGNRDSQDLQVDAVDRLVKEKEMEVEDKKKDEVGRSAKGGAGRSRCNPILV